MRSLAGILLCLGAFAATELRGAGSVRPGLVYAEFAGRKLRLDLYLPATPAPAAGHPVIISIHGGGWIMSDRRKDLFLRDLTNDGFAVASVDYRLASAARFPAQIEDCRLALRWVLDHGREYQLDPGRVGVTGTSAGGQLALLLGLAETRRFLPAGTPPFPAGTVKAICAFYPPTDLVAIVPEDRRDRDDNLVANLLGGPVSQRLDLARAASPIRYVGKTSPPTFFVHGDRDRVVPLAQSRRLYETLKAAGAPTHLTVYPGKGHAFGPRPDTRREIAEFFSRYLKP